MAEAYQPMWKVEVAVAKEDHESVAYQPWEMKYQGRNEAEARQVFCDEELAIDQPGPLFRRYREIKLWRDSELRLHVWRL